MKFRPQSSGGFLVWLWRDNEIEQPRIIREALDHIQSRGFSGVLVTLSNSRYELVDPKVVHAVTQASQWARSRNMLLWLQADPRRASRSLIAETDERTQYLILPPTVSGGSPETSGVIAPVTGGQFDLKLPFPALYAYTTIQEQAVRFDPAGLERAFIFQMRDGVILQNTVIDITPATRFLADMNTQTVEIFGEVGVPESETWYVTAFARFETNLYDFAGRESNDILRHFVEDLFDSAAYLDGIAWDTIGYPGGRWDFPVSLSIYLGFAAEFGYDLRDVLHALLFDVDTGLHLKVRRDYHHFLMESILEAQHDLYALFHSYFGTIESVLETPLAVLAPEGSACCTLRTDHWPVVRQSTSALAGLDRDCENLQVSDALLTDLARLRSQGIFSKNRKAYCRLTHPGKDFERLRFCTDLLALFSIRWMLQTESEDPMAKNADLSAVRTRIPFDERIDVLNERLVAMLHLTGFRFPEPDLAMILPVDTLMTESHASAAELMEGLNRLTGGLIRAGFSVDVLTSSAFTDAKPVAEGVKLQHRIYRGVLFPYPKIIPAAAVDLIHAMDRQGVPYWIGGMRPEMTTEGVSVGHRFDVRFDPAAVDPAAFDGPAETRRLVLPEHALGAVLPSGRGYHLLVCPDAHDRVVRGRGSWKGIEFELTALQRLSLFYLDPASRINPLF